MKKRLFFLVALMFTLGAIPASATDFHDSALKCVDVNNTHNFNWSIGGWAENTSTTSNLAAYCAVAYNIDHCDTITDSYMYVYDMNDGDNFSCTLYAVYSSGPATTTGDWETEVTSGFSSSLKNMHYTDDMDMTPGSSSQIQFQCTVPHKYGGNNSKLVNWVVNCD